MDGSQIAIIVAIVLVALLVAQAWRRAPGGRRSERGVDPGAAAMGGAVGFMGGSFLVDDERSIGDPGGDGDDGGGGGRD